MPHNKKPPQDDPGHISAEERDLFRQAMRHVKPITRPTKPTKPKPLSQRTKSTKPRPASRATTPRNIAYSHPADDDFAPQRYVDSHAIICFKRPGLQQRTWQRLKRGQLLIDASIDLHGMTASQAISVVERLLEQAPAENLRLICVIHGKGIYADNRKPVLKNVLNQWLRQHPQILAFHSAQTKHGGSGALYVLLRKPTGIPADLIAMGDP